MPRVCHFTGKKTSFGNQVTHRGKAKYLGGVGTKITGITARKFRPNIQKVRAIVNGRIVRIKVSAKAIRNGLVVKPIRRKYSKPAPAKAAAPAVSTRHARSETRPAACAARTRASWRGERRPLRFASRSAASKPKAS